MYSLLVVAALIVFACVWSSILNMGLSVCLHFQITSLINKMKPFMEVSWEAATGALSDWDMDVQKAAWALQRDSLGALYEFINSEQEWAKVKQSDMCEIKKLLRGGGWTDNKVCGHLCYQLRSDLCPFSHEQAPLRLLVGECKFEDTVTANIVVQLMNHWEPVDRDRGIPNPQSYELQFYVNAAKEHRTFEDAKKSLSVDCTICIEDHIVHDVSPCVLVLQSELFHFRWCGCLDVPTLSAKAASKVTSLR